MIIEELNFLPKLTPKTRIKKQLKLATRIHPLKKLLSRSRPKTSNTMECKTTNGLKYDNCHVRRIKLDGEKYSSAEPKSKQ